MRYVNTETEPIVEPRKIYKVIIEQLSEETVEVEADSEIEAIDLVISGGGSLVDAITFSPTVIHTEELDG